MYHVIVRSSISSDWGIWTGRGMDEAQVGVRQQYQGGVSTVACLGCLCLEVASASRERNQSLDIWRRKTRRDTMEYNAAR